MWPRATVNPDLIYVRRHVDVLFVVSGCISRNRGSRNLQAGIETRRMDLIGTKLCVRPVWNPDFTHHILILSPQLCNALEKRTVVDTAFAQSRIVVLSRDLSRAQSLD